MGPRSNLLVHSVRTRIGLKIETGKGEDRGSDRFSTADRVYDHFHNVLKRLYGSYSSYVNVDMDDHSGSSSPIHWHESGADDVEVVEKIEFDVNLDAPCEKVYGNFDILKWWKRHSDTYKVLDEMARNILGVLVSTMSNWLWASGISIDVERPMDDMEKYEVGNCIYSLHL
ncbi:hypothetical protein Cgig2_014476 [Carnegiea gigantea]|uniref:HAT C-terminal dimerisation domain-containing protein n=1 Tax=Carnegiea gigantea TaxID=171969 RepID=A0A9Q1KA09_9CARY|nr:hypothetical protein Cgig2_014476 [Carnegiea gigantea]